MDKILEPLDLPCGQVIPNRLCKAAMTERLSNSDYSVNNKHIKLYQRWAQSNVGLHLSGNIKVQTTTTDLRSKHVGDGKANFDKYSRKNMNLNTI